MIGFTKDERSSFSYWFAHWCAFQMTALNLHIWKPKYLLHDIEKPWMKLILRDYKKVQRRHRYNHSHHLEYLYNHSLWDFDIDAYIIDNECSRFTKQASPVNAREFIPAAINFALDEESDEYMKSKLLSVKRMSIYRMDELGL